MRKFIAPGLAALALFGVGLALCQRYEAATAEELVCTRYVCVPAGSTAVPPTPDGTRPPDVTPSPVSSVTVTREAQPSAVPTAPVVCTRSTCVPAGSQ